MRIGVLGAGTWGMALARMLSNAGHEMTVWSALPAELEELDRTRKHKNLQNMEIPSGIVFTTAINEICNGKDILLFAVPSVFVRTTARKASFFVQEGQLIVDVAKGIEPDTLMTMTEVISSEIPQAKVVALSGPTHAEEVAKDLPTTIVAAHEDVSIAETVQGIFTNPVMRVYTKAALITRGLAEIERLGVKMGCLPETFSGLAGIGDLIVTATSKHSRNNQCGYLIGQGYEPSSAVKAVGMVVEGINAIPAAIALAEKYDVEMPIIAAVDAIINHGADPKNAVRELMGRDSKTELPKPVLDLNFESAVIKNAAMRVKGDQSMKRVIMSLLVETSTRISQIPSVNLAVSN